MGTPESHCCHFFYCERELAS
uniref:Uncharacterized protein n=1 Tax=Anguilla anguilla TaxID=7936 RepID=A0A0E9UFV6_ANGAN